MTELLHRRRADIYYTGNNLSSTPAGVFYNGCRVEIGNNFSAFYCITLKSSRISHSVHQTYANAVLIKSCEAFTLIIQIWVRITKRYDSLLKISDIFILNVDCPITQKYQNLHVCTRVTCVTKFFFKVLIKDLVGRIFHY